VNNLVFIIEVERGGGEGELRGGGEGRGVQF